MKNILYPLIALFLVGCTAPLDINTRDAEPKLSIYCSIDDSIRYQIVYVTRSAPYFSGEPTLPIMSAVVTVSGSDGSSYPFRFESGDKNYYISQTQFGAQPGVTYTLSVKADFNQDGVKEEYTATSTCLPPIAMDSIAVQSAALMGQKHYSIYLELTDPSEPNWYLVFISQNGVLRNGKISKIQAYSDVYPFPFNGQTFKGILLQIFDSQQSWEAKPEIARREDNYFFSPGDEIAVQLSNIEKGYYEFVYQCKQSSMGGSPMFGGQSSNITTNLSGGAVGYFATYTLTTLTAIVPE